MDRLEYTLKICGDMRTAGRCPLDTVVAAAQAAETAADDSWETENNRAQIAEDRNELLEVVIRDLAREAGVKPPAGIPLDAYIDDRLKALEAERAEELGR